MSEPIVIRVDPADRPAWLAQRRKGIGSSDVAAVLGMSPWASPYLLWVEKVEDDLPEQEDTDALRWGRRLEAVIADEFAERHPDLAVVKPDVMYAHAAYPHMQANPDRLLFAAVPDPGPVALLEIKSSNYADDWQEDPPDHVLLQVQHQLAVMDLPKAWIALLMFGREYREWEIERDEATIALLIEHEREFWRRVLEQDPPAIDGDEHTTEALKALYDDPDDEAVEGGDVARTLLSQRKALKQKEKDLAEELGLVENQLRAMFGNHSRLLVDGTPAATWSLVVQQKVDMKALEDEHPEIVAKYRKPSSHRRFMPKKEFA